MEPLLPDNDRDAELARRLKKRLDEGLPLDDDPAEALLVRALREAKTARQAEEQAAWDQARTDRLWARIEAATAPGASPPVAPRRRLAVVHRLRPVYGAAIAACLLVALALGWYVAGRGADPLLVAQAEAEMVRYTAPDGSVVTLRPNSALYAVQEGDEQMQYRLEGEAFFDVVPQPSRRFEVEAGAGRVTVLGTRFDVSTWGEQTVVFLAEGRVRFERVGTDAAVVLTPGQTARLTEAARAPSVAAAEARVYLDWLDDELYFEQQPLDRIVAELAHHYGIRITVPESLQAETLSGPLPLGDLAQSLRDLGMALRGRFVQDGPAHYRFTQE